MAANKKVILVVGPTAVGKTAVAISIAKRFQTEIISADSRQCFKELNIGVARPSPAELQAVPHHFIASHSIHDPVNASLFGQYALEKVHSLFRAHDEVVMAGGTGLYVKAFAEGMDEIPGVDEEIRAGITEQYEKKGLRWLQEEIAAKDPEFYKVGEIQNPRRLMRALEVVEATGQSILSFRKGKKAKRDFAVVKIGLEVPKEQLHSRVNRRVDQMIAEGLVEEVRGLMPFKELNALQTVGYAEIFEYLGGRTSLSEAVDRLKINTRQYAKRQLTWFKKDKEIRWFAPTQEKEIFEYIT